MQNWVNFRDVKHSIPFAPLLRQYHVELRRSGRDQYRGCCPIHGGQSRDAFHVNLTKNLFTTCLRRQRHRTRLRRRNGPLQSAGSGAETGSRQHQPGSVYGKLSHSTGYKKK